MIKHYLKIGWRNLWKHTPSTVISIAGLAVGLLCYILCTYCFLLLIKVDEDFENKERIAKVELKTENGQRAAKTTPSTGSVLKDFSPGLVQYVTGMSIAEELNIRLENESGNFISRIARTIEVDSNFHKVFSVSLLEGNWPQILNQKNGVILTRSYARRVYGDKSPLGKMIHPNELRFASGRTVGDPEELGNITYYIVGVIEDIPLNASFTYLKPLDILFINDEYGVFSNIDYLTREGWLGCHHYVLLSPGIGIKEINSGIDRNRQFVLLWDQRYYPQFNYAKDAIEIADKIFAYFILCLGIFILSAVVLNFLTLAGGNFISRNKEYSIRKSLGGTNVNLFKSLFIEILLILIPVGILVACLIELSVSTLDFNLVYINFVLHSGELFRQLICYWSFGVLLCALVCWILSAKIYRNSVQKGVNTNKQRLRNIILCIQFVICLLFLSCTAVIYMQTGKMLGTLYPNFSEEEKENILEVNINYPQTVFRVEELKTRFLTFPGVVDILMTDMSLLDPHEMIVWETPDRRGDYIIFSSLSVGNNFFSFMNISLLDGSFPIHKDEIVVDKNIGKNFPQNIFQRTLYNNLTSPLTITAVCEEIIMSDHFYHRPAAIMQSEKPLYMYLKVIPEQLHTVRSGVKSILNEYLSSGIDHQVYTFSEALKLNNITLIKFRSILMLVTLVSIIITILGIYSAITQDVRRRQKEVAIRKVNGASDGRVGMLFLKTYLWLLLIASILVLPLMWFLTEQFLQTFKIRFDNTIWFWLLILLMVAFVVFITVAGKIIRIIRIKPAEILKNE